MLPCLRLAVKGHRIDAHGHSLGVLSQLFSAIAPDWTAHTRTVTAAVGSWHCSVSAAQPIQLICLLIPHGLVRLIECSPSGPQHSQVPSPGVFDPGWTLSLSVHDAGLGLLLNGNGQPLGGSLQPAMGPWSLSTSSAGDGGLGGVLGRLRVATGCGGLGWGLLADLGDRSLTDRCSCFGVQLTATQGGRDRDVVHLFLQEGCVCAGCLVNTCSCTVH